MIDECFGLKASRSSWAHRTVVCDTPQQWQNLMPQVLVQPFSRQPEAKAAYFSYRQHASLPLEPACLALTGFVLAPAAVEAAAAETCMMLLPDEAWRTLLQNSLVTDIHCLMSPAEVVFSALQQISPLAR